MQARCVRHHYALCLAYDLARRRLFKLTKAFGGGGGGEHKPVPLAAAEEARAKVVAFQGHVSTAACLQAHCIHVKQGAQDQHAPLAGMISLEGALPQCAYRSAFGN